MEDDFIRIAEVFLRAVAGELDPYTTEKNIVKRTGALEVTLFTPSHIQFARYGRGPGKRPPLDPILEWVGKKGIATDPKEARGTAFAIMESISKKGTKNWKPGAPNALDEAINNNLADYMKALNIDITLRQAEEVNETIEQAFPKEIEFKI